MRSAAGAPGTQQQGTLCCGVALRSSVEAIRYNEPARRTPVVSGTPQRSTPSPRHNEVFFFNREC